MEAHYIGIDIGSTATKLAALSGERALLGTTVVPFGTRHPGRPIGAGDLLSEFQAVPI